MLYFHNTFQEIQKFATYATKGFQLLGAGPRIPDPLTSDQWSVVSGHWSGDSDQGLCPWTPLGAQALNSPNVCYPPKPRLPGLWIKAWLNWLAAALTIITNEAVDDVHYNNCLPCVKTEPPFVDGFQVSDQCFVDSRRAGPTRMKMNNKH